MNKTSLKIVITMMGGLIFVIMPLSTGHALEQAQAIKDSKKDIKKTILSEVFGIGSGPESRPTPPAPTTEPPLVKARQQTHPMSVTQTNSGEAMNQYRRAEKERSAMIDELRGRAAAAPVIADPDQIMLEPEQKPDDTAQRRQKMTDELRRIQEEWLAVAQKHAAQQAEVTKVFQARVRAATSPEERQSLRMEYQRHQQEAAQQMQQTIMELRKAQLEAQRQGAATAYQRQQIDVQQQQQQDRQDRAQKQMEKSRLVQEIAQEHVLAQQAALKKFQNDMQNATTQEERMAIQKFFKEEQQKTNAELQKKVQELRGY